MISVITEYDRQKKLRAFTVKNHGESHVCAAVSLLTLNTVNSIEKFTDTDFNCEYDENGGFIRFAFNGEAGREAELLTEALLLGLHSVMEKYPKEIEIKQTKGS